MVTITTAQTKTVLHLDKGEKTTIIYSDGAHTHKINRYVWTAKEDSSTWARFCDQWNRVYKRDDCCYVDGMYKNNVYDYDSFAE